MQIRHLQEHANFIYDIEKIWQKTLFRSYVTFELRNIYYLNYAQYLWPKLDLFQLQLAVGLSILNIAIAKSNELNQWGYKVKISFK